MEEEYNHTIQDVISDCYGVIDALLDRYSEAKITISISTDGENECELCEKYSECVKANSINRFFGGNTVIYYGDIASISSVDQPIFYEILSHKNLMLSALTDQNIPTVWYCYEKIVKMACKISEKDIKLVYGFYNQLLLRLYEIRESVEKKEICNTDAIFAIVPKCNNISEMNDAIKLFIESIINSLENKEEKE